MVLFLFFTYGYPSIAVLIAEKTVLSQVNFLCTLLKISHICVCLLPNALLVPFICLSTPILLVLKSDSISPPVLLFLYFKVVLALLGPLRFHINFIISLSISTAKHDGLL